VTWATGTKVTLESRAHGTLLQVNGQDFLVRGMNWDYFPIGTNYTYSLWNQPDDYIISVLQTEMTLLKQMGVNTLRIYTGIPKKWIQYIYEQFRIYTILNHPFGRYGLTVEGDWMANPRYDDPRVRDLLLKEVRRLTRDYMDTPGLLLFLLGNENNYGLFWEDTEPNGTTSSQRAEETDLPLSLIHI